MPGPMRYDVNPYMREIVDCFDVGSSVRMVVLKKGVQVTYSTAALEAGLLYMSAHVKTVPVMYMTADLGLAKSRIENNVIPMYVQSGIASMIRSSDTGNKRKTGQTKDTIQWEGGGYLVPFGAISANKMRSFSIHTMLMDEVDAWPDTVGKDGDPVGLAIDRCSAYWDVRKVFMGSTPLLKESSKVERAYLLGDQRKYFVCCVSCGFPQELRWSGTNDDGKKFGVVWETDNGQLINESVRYLCKNCQHPHHEYDKVKLFSPSHGAEWVPTAKPKEEHVRSYHLPALYSPYGMAPWYKCVSNYLAAYDPETKTVLDYGKFQVFYNNILAEPFDVVGGRVSFATVSAHRRSVYRRGETPDDWALRFCGSKILFFTCAVDVHKDNLAVAIFGWALDSKCFLVDYFRLENEDCTSESSPVWGELTRILLETKYGDRRILVTLIDAGYAQDTVSNYCAAFSAGVIPILGRDRPARNQRIKEFDQFRTQTGQVGYRITVDHYKDRAAPVLRRDWSEQSGEVQRPYHFNAPVDMPDNYLKELTVERKREKRDAKGIVSYEWYRPHGVKNELWDLLIYGYATVEILARSICVDSMGKENIDWPMFWKSFE